MKEWMKNLFWYVMNEMIIIITNEGTEWEIKKILDMIANWIWHIDTYKLHKFELIRHMFDEDY